MAELEDKGVPFLGCEKCFGLFVTEPDLFTYVEQASSPKVFATFLQLHEKMLQAQQPGTMRECPFCGAKLARVTIGENPIVLLDRCGEHGLWLDRTELKKVIRTSRAASGQKPDPHADADDEDEGPMAPKPKKKK
jgi:Zn-finger nucleic acid-binding protein